MKTATKYIPMLAAVAFLLAGALTGCVKDKVDEPGGYDENGGLAADEYGMGITVTLDGLTRAGSGGVHGTGIAIGEEDYVDTEHLYILFFNIDGVFLFAIQNPVAVPMGSSGTGNDRQWFIRIPVKQVEEISPDLIKYIEDHPFKVAVLANWTFDEGDNADTWNGIRFEFRNPVDKTTGKLTYDDNGRLVGDNLTMLSHAQVDNVYRNLDNHGYDHLVYFPIDEGVNDKPHMGPYIEWVKNFHSSIDAADTALRNDYNVDKHCYTNSAMDSRATIDYNDMWRLWNFGGSNNSSKEGCYVTGNSTIRNKWVTNNNNALTEFYNSYNASQLAGSSDKYWPLKNHEKELLFHGPVERVKENNRDTGIKIPVAKGFTESMNSNGDGFPASMSYAHFYAKADGYLRVRYKSVGGAKIKAHIGLYHYDPPADDTQRRHNRESRDMKPEDDSREGEVYRVFGDIPNLNQHVFIYAVEPDDDTETAAETAAAEEEPGIIVYEIEYIESRHLYDVDREGRLPSKSYPIPMYGIQDFDPIGEYWQPGMLFNLSMFNNAVKEGYNYRTISLLRSLARVEVLISKETFGNRRPSHVFMRSMNRSARITPVDFFTPTDIIWNGYDQNSVSDNARLQHYIDAHNLAQQNILTNCAGVDSEIRRIMQFGPIYIGRDSGNREPNSMLSTAEKLTEYRMTTAWPFGIWEQQWGWNWNRVNENEAVVPGRTVEWFDTYKPGEVRDYHGQLVPDYPHILHTRISRSDYARFHYMGEQEGFYRYLIYIPEKNITDADNPGNIADRPKVIHVEVRFNRENEDPDDNYVDNFDDNGAFRMYFTPGGRSPKYDSKLDGNEFSRMDWDNYEYDWESLCDHWPIIRNHIYRFEVTGGGPNGSKRNIAFSVEAPDQRSASWYF